MSGNAPESMLYENTVLLLNYTGIDAHTVKQHESLIMISCARIHPCRDDIVPRSGFEPEAFCSVDRRAIQLRYQGNVRMMVPMRLAFRRPSRTQPARGGFRMLPDESECPVLHRMEQHDEYNECISDLHSLYSSWLIM